MIKIQLSDFQYIERGTKSIGRALRFTICWRIKISDDEFWEIGWEGNMASYGVNGLRWTPPITRFSPTRYQQLHWLNPPIYNRILKALLDRPELIEPLKTPIQELLKKKIMSETPRIEVPQVIDVMEME